MREAARPLATEVLLAGILPTLQKSDLQLSSITPNPRYLRLNDAIMRMRGGQIGVHIKGVDEVNVSSDNIMLLSSNTSFQVHLQVSPAEFVPLYNMAQVVSAPLLAAAVNSPLWLGNRLWQETRIALFAARVSRQPPSSSNTSCRSHAPDSSGRRLTRRTLTSTSARSKSACARDRPARSGL